MTGRERVDPDDVDVSLDGLACHLFRGLEERADVDVEAEVGERRRDDFLAAVVAVLTHLRDQDAGPAPFGSCERVSGLAHLLDGRRLACFCPVDAADGTDLTGVPAVDLLQGERDFPDGRLRPRRVDGEGEQVVTGPGLVHGGGSGQLGKRLLARRLVALLAQAGELGQLPSAHGGVVDGENLDVLRGRPAGTC